MSDDLTLTAILKADSTSMTTGFTQAVTTMSQFKQAAQSTSSTMNQFKQATQSTSSSVSSSFSSTTSSILTLKSSLQDTEEETQSLGSKISDALGSAATFVIGLAGQAVNFLKDQLVDSIKVAEAHQLIMTQTAQAIKSTGDASGMSAKQIGDLAEALSKTTPFADDVIQRGENLLLTFTNIGKDVFPQATQSILDISQAMGQDLKTSAIQVGKALNDPLTGMGNLQRIGVTFDATEKRQIKTMMAHNDVMGAQKIILGELNKEFGGSAVAAGKTYAGQLQILSNQFENLKQKVGMAVLPILSTLTGFILSAVTPALDALGSFVQNKVTPVLQAFADILQSKVFPVLSSWGHNIQNWVIDKLNALKSFIDANIMPKLTEFWNFIQTKIVPVLQSWGDAIKTWVIDKLADLKAFIDANIMPKLHQFWDFIQAKITPVLKVWGENIKSYVIDKLADLKSFIDTNIMPKLHLLWSFIQNDIVPVLKVWGENIKTWVIDKLADLKSFIDANIMPNLNKFWSFVQKQIIPMLQTWGDNIKKYVLDKLNDLKIFIDQHIMPKLHQFWDFITNQIVPTLQRWGDAIKKYALDKLSDLKDFIEKNVLPNLTKLWSFIQNDIVPIFTSWDDEMGNVRTGLDDMKGSIEKNVLPVLLTMWNFIQTSIVPIFQSLGNVVKNDVLPHWGDFKESTDKLGKSLGHLWDVISPILLPVLAALGLSAGVETKGKLDGMKSAIDFVGVGINAFLKGVNDAINVLSDLIDWLSTAIGWINSFDAGLTNAAVDIINFLSGGTANLKHVTASGGIVAAGESGGVGGGAVKGFASGIENFKGGLAIVGEQGPELVNLPRGSTVLSNSKTSALLNSAKSTFQYPASGAVSGGAPVIHVHVHPVVQPNDIHLDGHHLANKLGPHIANMIRLKGDIRAR